MTERFPAMLHRRPMSHSVERHLAVTAADYDVEIHRFIPAYDAMLDELVEALASLLPGSAGPRVLDLGAGTGALSARIAARVPAASLTLLDADPAMLAQAEQRLALHRARATFVQGSFFDPLPTCDVAVASLALHHVRDLDEKGALYRNVHRAIAPGGFLLDADVTMPNAPALADRTWRRWAAHLVAHGDTEAQAYARFADWAKEDRYCGIDEDLSLLRAAGFAGVDVLFCSGPSRVLAAVR
jgi:tRNA (cmo5U34)-methyltransferase